MVKLSRKMARGLLLLGIAIVYHTKSYGSLPLPETSKENKTHEIETINIALPPASPASNWDFSGLLRAAGALSGNGGIDEQASVEFRGIALYKNKRLTGEIHYDLIGQYQKKGGYGIPLLQPLNQPDLSIFPASTIIENNANTISVAKLDRFNLAYENDMASVFVGRKAMTWSRGNMFHPLDFFHPTTPSSLDGSYKRGTDVVGFTLGKQRQQFTAVFVPSKELVAKEAGESLTFDGGDFSWNYSTAVVNYTYASQAVDFSVIGGQYLGDNVLGMGGAVNVPWSMVLRADVAWMSLRAFPLETQKQEGWYPWLVVNLQRNFSVKGKDAYVYLEYFYNSMGEKSSFPQSIDSLNPIFQKRLYMQDIYLVGAHYGVIAGNITISDYSAMTISVMMSLNDFSTYNTIGWTYTASDTITYATYVVFPVGKKGTEFGGWTMDTITYKVPASILATVIYEF